MYFFFLNFFLYKKNCFKIFKSEIKSFYEIIDSEKQKQNKQSVKEKLIKKSSNIFTEKSPKHTHTNHTPPYSAVAANYNHLNNSNANDTGYNRSIQSFEEQGKPRSQEAFLKIYITLL